MALNSAEVGQDWPEFGPMSTKSGRKLAEFDQNWWNYQIWPDIGRIWPDCGQIWAVER